MLIIPMVLLMGANIAKPERPSGHNTIRCLMKNLGQGYGSLPTTQ